MFTGRFLVNTFQESILKLHCYHKVMINYLNTVISNNVGRFFLIALKRTGFYGFLGFSFVQTLAKKKHFIDLIR